MISWSEKFGVVVETVLMTCSVLRRLDFFSFHLVSIKIHLCTRSARGTSIARIQLAEFRTRDRPPRTLAYPLQNLSLHPLADSTCDCRDRGQSLVEIAFGQVAQRSYAFLVSGLSPWQLRAARWRRIKESRSRIYTMRQRGSQV